jgi:sRNA-binding protein
MGEAAKARKAAKRRAKKAAKREELAQWRGFKTAKDMDRVVEVRTDSPTSKRKPSRVWHIS